MRAIHSFFKVFVLAALATHMSSTLVWADEPGRAKNPLGDHSASANVPDTDADDDEGVTIIIERRIGLLFVQEPDRYFQKAAEAYKAGKNKIAAAEIRRAATILKLEAAAAEREDRAPLEGAIFDLEVLAKEVAGGRLKSEQTLNRLFALAHYHMARFHERQADKEWKADDAEGAGEELRAASHHLEHGFAWAGQPEAEGLAAALDILSSTAGNLLGNADVATADQVAGAVAGLTRQLAALSKQVKPDQPHELSAAAKQARDEKKDGKSKSK